jgi:hypothetical protein
LLNASGESHEKDGLVLPAEGERMASDLGCKIKTLRQSKRMMLDQLAEIAQSSKSYIWAQGTGAGGRRTRLTFPTHDAAGEQGERVLASRRR